MREGPEPVPLSGEAAGTVAAVDHTMASAVPDPASSVDAVALVRGGLVARGAPEAGRPHPGPRHPGVATRPVVTIPTPRPISATCEDVGGNRPAGAVGKRDAMIGTVFRSEDLPAGERFDHWRAMVGQTRSPSDIISAHTADFWAEARLMELGPVTVWPTSFLPTRYRRSQKMVRQSDPELYHLSLLLDGGMALDHVGRTAVFGPRDLHLADSSQPYDLQPYGVGPGRVVKGVGVDFPKALLPLPPHRVRELLGRGLSGRDGLGALLTDFLVGLERQADHLQPADGPRLGTVVLDLVSAWCAHALEAEAALPPETRQQVMVRRIQAFIRQNLHDPELSPPAIAAAHHISVSYLHRIFQQQTQGETVAAWIRRRRLEGAHRDLADPSLRATPIHTVAARWGIPRASDFTRAFRAAYGLSPKEYRLQTLAERECEAPLNDRLRSTGSPVQPSAPVKE
ncbi:helix-turn-helix domain-containing protein [Streptomyces ipomoeae]|nr:helix-turn-helix domain-containing protein [Streptomyces ipomoeae]